MPGRRRNLRFLRWLAAEWANWIGLNNCRKKRVVLFRRVAALDYCNFELFPGEILAVISDNWASKSTLIKAVSARLSPAKAKSNSGGSKSTSFHRPTPGDGIAA